MCFDFFSSSSEIVHLVKLFMHNRVNMYKFDTGLSQCQTGNRTTVIENFSSLRNMAMHTSVADGWPRYRISALAIFDEQLVCYV